MPQIHSLPQATVRETLEARELYSLMPTIVVHDSPAPGARRTHMFVFASWLNRNPITIST
jgi:hypothetical protein